MSTKDKLIDNPFVLNGYCGAQYFCDRVEESEKLVSILCNGSNVVLTSPRRIGKSDFISHVFDSKDIKRNFITIQVDIFATDSLERFVEFLGKSILAALKPRGRAVIENFLRVVRSIQSQVTIDAFGNPNWMIGLGKVVQPELTLEEIFEYLNNAPRPCLVAIDEFQQITRYKNAWQVEALLRTYIQKCPNSRFIFSGSQRHLMAEIFNSPSRPFYGSVAFMSLPKLDADVYADFCRGLFKKFDKSISADAVMDAYNKLGGVTAYVQRVLNMLFSMTQKGEECVAGQVDRAIETIIRNNADVYMSLYHLMTSRQREVLIAIAKEGEARNVQGAAFIRKYNLGSSSIVASAIRTLLDKDMITSIDNGYTIYDRFFSHWLSKTF